MYGRLVPASAIRADAIRIVDVNQTPELARRVRTFGTSVSGYQAGWFRLRNGEKALLYLTDRRQAVYVPTTAGFSIVRAARHVRLRSDTRWDRSSAGGESISDRR